MAWSPRSDGLPAAIADAHAGRLETSLLLALAPATVALDVAARGNDRPLAELDDRLRSDGVRAVSSNGVLGDPSGASAMEGEDLLDAFTADLVGAVDRFLTSSAVDG